MYLIFDISINEDKNSSEAYEIKTGEIPRLIQIAWAVFDKNFKHIDFQAYYIKPVNFTVPKSSFFLQKISQATLENRGLSINIVLNKIIDVFAKYDNWISHDIDYKLSVIASELLEIGVSKYDWDLFIKSKQRFCTKRDIRVIKYINKYIDPGSERLPTLANLYYELFNEPLKEPFNAEIDVMNISKCFWELVNRNCYNHAKPNYSRIHLPIPAGLPELIPFRSEKKWGFCNSNKEIRIKEVYNFVSDFKNNYALAKEENGKYILLDKYGNSLNIGGQNAHQIYNEDFIIVKNQDKFGVYNYFGKEIIKPVFCEIRLFFEGIILVQLEKNERFSIVDKNGSFLRSTNYSSVSYLSEGKSKISCLDKNLVGYLNEYGEEIIPCNYDNGEDFRNGFAKVLKFNNGWGLINKFGEVMIPLIYESISDINNGLVIVKKNGKYGILSINGKLIIDCTYQGIEGFQDGVAKATNNYEYTYINLTGDIILYLKGIQYANSFSEGMCLIKDKGKYGFINKSGQIIVNCKYNDAKNFSAGLAAVKMHNKWGFIDKLGNELTELKYDDIYSSKDGLASVCIANKWGVINNIGNEIIKCRYDKYLNFNFKKGPKYKIAIVELNGKKGLIDSSGNEIVPCVYWHIMDSNWSTNVNNGLFSVLDSNLNFIGYIDKSGEEYFE